MKTRLARSIARSSDEAAAPIMTSQLRSRNFTPLKAADATAQPSQAGFDAATVPVLGPSALVQTKLTVGQPGDKYEQEADAVAAQVVSQIHSPQPSGQANPLQREAAAPEEEEKLQQKPLCSSIQRAEMPKEEEEIQTKPLAASIQRAEASEEKEEELAQMKPVLQREAMPEEAEKAVQAKPEIQRETLPEEPEKLQKKAPPRAKASGPLTATPSIESEIAGARGGGQALGGETLAQMEGAFGADFSGVRLHTDERSNQLNQALQARAFTTGRDIFFKQGEYRPRDRGGQALLAHELTHVVQQSSTVQPPQSVQAQRLDDQSFSIRHSVTLFPQPDNMSCWSAAATMILGGNQSVGAGDGELGATGGLKPQSVPAFAASHGLVVHYPQSWTPVGLAELLEAGPLWMAGALPSLHAVVISAIHGDGTAENTFLTVYDPWPPGQGRIIRDIPYAALMQTFPMATMYLLHQ